MGWPLQQPMGRAASRKPGGLVDFSARRDCWRFICVTGGLGRRKALQATPSSSQGAAREGLKPAALVLY